MSRASKPPKARKGAKTLHRAHGGPFDGHDFALAEPSTMVFAIDAHGRRWRGQYVTEGHNPRALLKWQDVPLAGATA